MLESELAGRGASMDPLGVEQAIDQLWASHGERARQGAQALKTLGKIGLTVANVIRTRELPELPDMSVPDWLEPPTRAVYVVPQCHDPGRQWTEVQLDEGSAEWLQRVHAAVPRLFKSVESASLDAWLDRGSSQDEGGLLQVHLGERRVLARRGRHRHLQQRRGRRSAARRAAVRQGATYTHRRRGRLSA